MVVPREGCGGQGRKEDFSLLTPCPLHTELYELTCAQNTQRPLDMGHTEGTSICLNQGEQEVAGSAALRGLQADPRVRSGTRAWGHFGPVLASVCWLVFHLCMLLWHFVGAGHIGSLKTSETKQSNFKSALHLGPSSAGTQSLAASHRITEVIKLLLKKKKSLPILFYLYLSWPRIKRMVTPCAAKVMKVERAGPYAAGENEN